MKRVAALGGLAVTLLAHASVDVPSAHGADLDCLIQPKEVIAVSSPVQGVLETMTVDRGDLVLERAVLAELESSTERAAVAVARARAERESEVRSNQVKLDFGARRFLRTDEMFKKDLIPLKELDEAETAKILAEIGIIEAQENKRLAELELERTVALYALRTIRSPITGVVTERLLAPGEFTGQGPILKLAQIDPLRVEVFVPVSLFGKVAVGMRALVIPEPPANTPREALVTVVDRVIDAASGTFGVRLELSNPGYRLPAGLKCKVRFPLDAAR